MHAHTYADKWVHARTQYVLIKSTRIESYIKYIVFPRRKILYQLRKHAYSNILKISQPKTERFR